MTVLGDLAQATAPAAQQSWDAAVAALGGPADGRSGPTSTSATGSRRRSWTSPTGLLAEAAPDVVPTRSVRAGGRPPTVVAVGGATALVAAVGGRRRPSWPTSYSSVAVVVPDDAAAVDGDGAGRRRRRGGAQPRHDARPAEAKGLEFDAVVVVEPAAIVGRRRARGLRLLYVALTRAVQELVVVHHRPLPGGLDMASSR